MLLPKRRVIEKKNEKERVIVYAHSAFSAWNFLSKLLQPITHIFYNTRLHKVLLKNWGSSAKISLSVIADIFCSILPNQFFCLVVTAFSYKNTIYMFVVRFKIRTVSFKVLFLVWCYIFIYKGILSAHHSRFYTKIFQLLTFYVAISLAFIKTIVHYLRFKNSRRSYI